MRSENSGSKEEVMNRRDLLQAVTSAVAGAGLMAGDPEGVWANANGGAPSKAGSAASGPFIATRDRAMLFYKDWGVGKPVLFVHSWAANTSLWQYQMIDLCSRGFRCVAYDQRGFGRSSDPGRGYDYDTLADDLGEVIEKLDLRDVALVGHSMGCGEIVRYVSRHGSARVSRAVLVAPTLPFILKTADNPDGVDKSALEQQRAEWMKDFPKWLGENARPFFTAETSPEMVQWGVTMGLQASLKALVDCNRVVAETDFRPELPKFTVPTLVVQGDADASARLEFTGQRTARLIPGSQLKVYEGAPHGLMFTHIDRLNADLRSFLTA
jgi:non-heme chloroperoxidase